MNVVERGAGTDAHFYFCSLEVDRTLTRARGADFLRTHDGLQRLATLVGLLAQRQGSGGRSQVPAGTSVSSLAATPASAPAPAPAPVAVPVPATATPAMASDLSDMMSLWR
jgi:hypothetical protein